MRFPHAFARLLSLALFIFLSLPACVVAAEPFFKKDDVIALVGGEDMVVASEYGYLELLLTRALPDYHLRFRNLAWEGDTVFEQRRDLNFPTWEEQLDKIGATVVIAQFGQMESLAGEAKLSDFVAAYRKLIERFIGGGKRRLILLGPTSPPPPSSGPKIEWYSAPLPWIVQDFAGAKFVPAVGEIQSPEGKDLATRDGLHLNDFGHWHLARFFISATKSDAALFDPAKLRSLGGSLKGRDHIDEKTVRQLAEMDPERESELRRELAPLRQLIIAKNRLWFDYWRPQNWAFLAGDRVNQPSSRDWRDPSIRWFPPEREQFLPLIEAKEKEIDALAAKLAKP